MGTIRLPFASPLESRDGTLARDARLKNCVIENGDGQKLAVKRPGVTNRIVLPSGAAQGMVWLNGILYSVIDDKMYFSPGSVSYSGGYGLATDTAISPPATYNYAIDQGPTYPLTPAEYMNSPYSWPTNLKDFPSIAAIVALMNSNYSGIGVWSYSDPYGTLPGGPTNYPNFIGYVWANLGADSAYIQVLQH